MGDEQKEHAKIIAGRDYKIDRLRKEIRRIKDDSKKRFDENQKRWAMEEKRRQEAYNKEFKEKSEKLAKLKKEFDDKSEDNFTKELRLHNMKYKKEAELETKIKLYDKDISDLYSKISELQAMFDDEQAELRGLEEHFRKKREIAERIERERKKNEAARRKYITMKRIQRDAALLLQSLYKQWWVKQNKGKGGKDAKGKK